MPTRSAKADWRGTLQEGRGNVHFGDFSEPYNFTGRVSEERIGTTAEELVAAAQASCYNLALAVRLNNQGLTIERLDTTCKVTLTPSGVGLKISRIVIETRAKVPGLSAADFEQHAQAAKDTCPVSNALIAVGVTVSAELIVD